MSEGHLHYAFRAVPDDGRSRRRARRRCSRSCCPGTTLRPASPTSAAGCTKPAGKFGPSRRPGRAFLHRATGASVFSASIWRFGATFPAQEEAEKVAARLAKFGINIVRFHIMDMQRFPNGIWRRTARTRAPSTPKRSTGSTTSSPNSSGTASTSTSAC